MLGGIMSTLAMLPRIPLPPGAWYDMGNIVDEAKTLGELLKTQYEKHVGARDKAERIDQGEVALKMGINQGTLSKVQNDKSPGTAQRWGPNQVMALLNGYKLNKQEMYEAAIKFDLRLPIDFAVQMRSEAAPIPYAQPLLGKLVQVRHLGEVNAGLATNGAYGVEMEKREILADYLDGSDPQACFLLDVTGDSMTCEDIRKSIPAGSTLVVDPTLRPERGDAIVCELEINGDRRGVVKIFQPTGRGVVLDSHNQAHSPILLTEDMECVVNGVVVNWIPPGRKALRKHFTAS